MIKRIFRMEAIVHDSMGGMEEVYPRHIYEPQRRQVAMDYVRHELRKFLPSLRDEQSWKLIDGDIGEWFDGAPFLYPVRDFWNGVHGIMMGYKLKNQLLAYVTAENVAWKREDIKIADLTPGITFEKEENLEEVKNHFALTQERLSDPIIVTQKLIDGQDKMVVYEGNGRLRLAILEGKTAMSAYVGRFVDERRVPENYWLSTSVLMEIVHFAKKASGEKNEELYLSYVVILKDMLKTSESGKYEMGNRAITGTEEFKKKLLTDLDLV